MTARSFSDMPLSLTLEDHLLLLADVEQVIREENGLLKRTGLPPDDEFIRRKSRLLPRLEASIDLLRTGAVQRERSTAAREYLSAAQRMLHRLLLLDRENEALLLRCVLHNGGLPSCKVNIGARPASGAV